MQASPSRNHPWLPVMLLAVVIPLILAFVYFPVTAASFRMFGLTASQTMLLLLVTVIGSVINIPLTRRKIQLADPTLQQMSPAMQRLMILFHYYPPAVVEEVIAVNVGGALVPLGFSVYLLLQPGAPIGLALLAAIVVAIIAKLLARPLPGVGITLPGFVPPIISAIVAFLLVHFLAPTDNTYALAAVAYVGGTLGTLVGADLLNLPLVLRGGLLAAGPQRIWRIGQQPIPRPDKPRVLSIGGAGIFDGVFLTGILAAFLVRLG